MKESNDGSLHFWGFGSFQVGCISDGMAGWHAHEKGGASPGC